MKISVAIMAVPARLREADRLAEALEAQRAASGAYPWPIDMVVDYEKLGCWGNARRCWMKGAERAGDAHLVVQDDVVLSRDFLTGVAFLHSMKPDRALSFFRSSTVAEARATNRHWIEVPRFLMAQALLMPGDLTARFVPWCDQREGTLEAQTWKHHDDVRQREFFRAYKVKVLQPVPSLVDHADVKSTMSHARGRVARWFIGADKSWQTIDWDLGANDPVKG